MLSGERGPVSADPVIQVRDLVKRYRGAPGNALDGVSFEVPAGALFCLLGPNGAGKTTTASILTTTLAPTSGYAAIAGLNVVTDQARVRREIGVVFQQPSLDANLTAEENIRLHAVLYGCYPWRPTWRLMPAGYRRQVTLLAETLDLAPWLHRRVRTLSGGTRRKLEIVRALLPRPRVLFLDEPTAGLDPQTRRGLWQHLDQVRSDVGATVLGGLAAIAQRDVLKLLRDRPRLAVNLAFPLFLVAGLGSLLQPTVGVVTGLNSVTVAFTGVLAATSFQSAAAGMISIVEDRETDFTRVLFVTPVSQATLIAGKVAGECLVALAQVGCVLAFAVAIGVPVPAAKLLVLVPACLAACLAGAAFGLVTVAVLPTQRSAMDVFQFLIIPQYVLAGVLVPLHGTATWIRAASLAMPLRYAVDLTRAAYYAGSAGYRVAVASSPVLDAVVTGGLAALFLAAGGALFSYRERVR